MNPNSLVGSTPELGTAGFDNSHPGAYVAKFNYDSSLNWLVNLNGSNDDQARALVFADNYVYVTGFTNSANFRTTSGAYQSSRPGNMDAFVVKMDAAGAITWSTYLGTSGYEHGEGIAVDSDGNVYVAGHTDSASFPMAGSPEQGSLGGKNDTFLAKFNSTGGLVWSTYLGGSSDDFIYNDGLALDNDSNVIISGGTSSSDFPTTTGAYSRTLSGTMDGFVAKFSPSGALVFSTYLGGTGVDFARQARADAYNDIFVVGETQSTDFPTSNADQAVAGVTWEARFTLARSTALSM
jgi:hypothetical protein